MNYLNIFDDAKIWIRYVHFLNRKYYKNGFLEIGAGIGSFTDLYKSKIDNITLSEVDETNHNILNQKYLNDKNITVYKKLSSEIDLKFKTIVHFNVLEHIKNDREEINNCLNMLDPGGHLIILVPAHNELFSNLDKAVGHYRRYEKSFFENLNLPNGKIMKLQYLDTLGYFLYFFNRFFFKKEVYPSKLKIFIWDKIITPITIFVDFLTMYKFGKNLLCVIRKD